jgi:hypothetical protein
VIASLLLGSILAVQDWKSDEATVILHRAASMAAPENSVPALVEAVRQGADGVEIDIRRTKDGHLILYHDDWLLSDLGAGAKMEDLTLEEARSLDIGSRWGEKWRGLKAPLFADVLQFAKANGLLLFLDIKTKGIESNIKAALDQAKAGSLVVHPSSLRQPNGRQPQWVTGWNYTEGGEEDPERMKAVAAKAPTAWFMVDDARSLAMALGRKPDRRPLVPWQESRSAEANAQGRWAGEKIDSRSEASARRGLWRFSTHPNPNALPLVRRLAVQSRRGPIRLDAIWALGASTDRADVELLEQIAVSNPNQDPSGEAFFPTFRQAAAACSLARRGADRQLSILGRSPGWLGTAAVLGAAAHGNSRLAVDLIRAGAPRQSLPFAVSYALRHPYGAEICIEGIKAGGFARKTAVFALAQIMQDRPEIGEQLKKNYPGLKDSLELAEYWSKLPAASP